MAGNTHRICGAILAGGESRRFGSDKAEAKISGKRLIDVVAAALEPQVDALVICGRDERGYVCLDDRPKPGLGPLGGLLAALLYATEHRYDAVLSAGCDVPDLPGDIVSRLAGEGAAIIERQPVIGFWPAGLAGPLRHFVAASGRALYGFADHVDARRVVLDAPLANVNRPEDLKGLR